MKSFNQIFQTFNWDDIKLSIYSKTASDVERALSKTKLDLDDFQALISPTAEDYIELMAQKSYALTRLVWF